MNKDKLEQKLEVENTCSISEKVKNAACGGVREVEKWVKLKMGTLDCSVGNESPLGICRRKWNTDFQNAPENQEVRMQKAVWEDSQQV